MSIVSLSECLDFMNIDSKGTFTITAANDLLVLTSDQGAANIDIADGSYEGDDLATTLQTAMNANDTLTGTGTISFVVSYSSTTYKFTVDAGSGHTIAYTHTGSDAGLTFGFDDDHSATQTITSDKAVPSDPSDIVQTFLDGVDQWVKEYCRKDFEETTYSNELYDGAGSPSLFVKNLPIISIVKVAVGRDNAIRIKNTSTDASYATVTVDSDSLDLLVAGGVNAHSSTALEFSTYTTLSALVTQIIATGSGWSAEIANTNYNSILSSELLVTDALYCGARANTTASWEYLQVAGQPVSGIRVNRPTGEIYYSGGFASGFQNITVSYTGGYTSASMPADVKLAVMIGTKALYEKRNQEGFGISDFSLGHLRVKYTEWIPDTVMMLDHYREIVI